MQLTEERGDVLVPWRRVHQTSSRVHHRLKPLQQVLRDAGVALMSNQWWSRCSWSEVTPVHSSVFVRGTHSFELEG